MKTKKAAAPRRLADADLGAVAGAILIAPDPCCGTLPRPLPWPLPVDPPGLPPVLGPILHPDPRLQ
ncbi:MAG TPA: hypothetical protein VM753_03570 [Anaeromyxobacter sp.]|jgi:hypothetical protein|nr:hypothetical protein [Anaeromyxobacter sp.]